MQMIIKGGNVKVGIEIPFFFQRTVIKSWNIKLRGRLYWLKINHSKFMPVYMIYFLNNMIHNINNMYEKMKK